MMKQRRYLSAATVLLSSIGTILLPSRLLFGSLYDHDSIASNGQTPLQSAKTTTRYYIYPEESISRKVQVLTSAMSSSDDHRYHCCRDPLSELAVHQALELHPLRTMDPDKADFFIVPTLISPLISYGCFKTDGENCTDFDDAFSALTSHPLFINDDNGKHHIIISLHYLGFSTKFAEQPHLAPLARNYHKLKNVIVANRFDPMETWEIAKMGRAKGHDYERFFRKEGTLITRAGYSVGAGLETYLPIVTASMKRFDESKYFIFYRTRSRSSTNNSTVYRHAPLKYTEELEPSSIGFDLPMDEWLEHFSSSKFCLVIRGDSPETHAFFHSIRCGCIPVVISDWYPDFAGPFKSTLDMRDFSIMIGEQDFISNPLESLQGLKRIERSVIESKVMALEYAQRVIFPDHPESLFVPAFLKEATNAVKLADDRKNENELPY